MRSPSQRWRLSIVERTPPSDVWLRISRGRGLDRPLRAVGDVERDQPAEPRIAHLQHRGMVGQPAGKLRRRLRLPPHAHLERVQAAQSIAAASGAAESPSRIRAW